MCYFVVRSSVEIVDATNGDEDENEVAMEKPAPEMEDTKIIDVKDERKPLLKDINGHLICILCGGYFVDATTIVECLHTFCRSCILKFFQTSKFCPICDVQVHKTKPHVSLRPDPIIQRIVYKTIPGLFQNEISRRKIYESESKSCSALLYKCEEYYFAPTEPISISLEYANDPTNTKEKPDEPNSAISVVLSDTVDVISHRRYLQCPAALKIRHIYKFIKLKYSLERNQEVEILYENVKLPATFSLMDVAYTFCWNREMPMRLRYHIFECTIVRVPPMLETITSEDTIVKNPSGKLSTRRNNVESVKEANREIVTTHVSNNTKLTLKRKIENRLKKPCRDDVEEQLPSFPEPSIKIPRLSEDRVKSAEIVADPKVEIKNETGCNKDSRMMSLLLNETEPMDDSKYENDIEEVITVDDDDDDALCISNMDEDTCSNDVDESSDQKLVIDTDCISKESQENSLKKGKSKRKNKKSKHHHHKRHHHRHHDRKKTPQATILHSPDTDIMKLKLKLNTVQDTKHHKDKESKRERRKRSPEAVSSSCSSGESTSGQSPSSSSETANLSRVDEDSIHSHISEVSVEENVDSSIKDQPVIEPPIVEQPPKAIEVQPVTTDQQAIYIEKPVAAKEDLAPIESLPENGPQTPTKLAFNSPKFSSPTSKEKLLQMRAFRPKMSKTVAESNGTLGIDDKNDEIIVLDDDSKPDDDNNNIADKTEESMDVKQIPSSLTVCKITVAEKLKMQQGKSLYIDGGSDDKPDVEITLVNGPPKNAAEPKAKSPKSTRPPPAAIPLDQYQKLKKETHLPKSLSIIPHIPKNKKINNTKTNEPPKRNFAVSYLPNDADPPGALDLSKSSRNYTKIPPARTITNLQQAILNKQITNSYRPIPNSPSPPNRYSPVNCMTSLAHSIRQFHKMPGLEMDIHNRTPKHPLMHPTNLKFLPTPPPSPKPYIRPTYTKYNKGSMMPKLNEIIIGPKTAESPPKPGPNQTVRHIPNPSMMLHRHQVPMDSCVKKASIVPRMNSCMFNSITKNGEKCPGAIPIKTYMDSNSTLMMGK